MSGRSRRQQDRRHSDRKRLRTTCRGRLSCRRKLPPTAHASGDVHRLGLATAFSSAIGGLSEEKAPYSSLYQGSAEEALGNPFAPRRSAKATAEPETQINGPRVIGGIAPLLAAPLVTFLLIVVSRVYMDLVIVLFRIAENIGEIKVKTRG